MLNPNLYKSSHVYDFFMKSLGYERSLQRFLQSIALDYRGSFKILDSGCGTGLIGLSLLQRFPEASLVATDLEPNFLQQTLSNADRMRLDRARVEVGLADISNPHQLRHHSSGASTAIAKQSITIACVGAVIGYSKDVHSSLRSLVDLMVPGGTLINLEMSNGLAGRVVSKRYNYQNLPVHDLLDLLSSLGCQVEQRNLSIRHLPAKLTRTAIIARKR
jgi:precorrin-6B methylase 2